MKYLLILGMIFSINLQAEEKSEEQKKKVEEVKEKVEDVKDAVETVGVESDKKWAAYLTYAYVDTWLPGKFGLTGVYGDESRTYELAYQSASYSFDFVIDDLGNVSDKRIHLSTRSHTWDGSFNFQYGVFYNALKIDLGNSYTDLVSGRFDVIELETLGVLWGVGNRWSWDSGLSVGMDWFKIFWPLMNLKEDKDIVDELPSGSQRDDIKELSDAISKIPTFTLAHFELGYRF